jgi:nicotinamide mononucleotide transporter
MGLLEIAANGMTTISILLAGRNSVHTWWTGITGCILFALLFFETSLYADVVLQLFFVVTSALGWWQWMKGAQGEALAVSRAAFRKLAWTIPGGVLATAGYGALLHFFTNAYAPFVDSAILVFSVIAQLLLMQRRLETWAFWLLVNTIAVPLYASRGLYLTAFLYAGYWINAVISWRWWQHRLAQPAAALR